MREKYRCDEEDGNSVMEKGHHDLHSRFDKLIGKEMYMSIKKRIIMDIKCLIY